MSSKTSSLFHRTLIKIKPIINTETTYFLFLSTIFNYFFYGKHLTINKFINLHNNLLFAIILCGFFTALLNLKINKEWKPICNLFVLIGDTLLNALLMGIFYETNQAPTPLELITQIYYLTHVLISFTLILTLLLSKPSHEIDQLEPTIISEPSLNKFLFITFSVICINVIAFYILKFEANQAANSVNLIGFNLLAIFNFVKKKKHFSPK